MFRLCAWLCLAMPAAALADHFTPGLVEEEVRIPAAGGQYTLAATILRPRGEGPYGAVVLNHCPVVDSLKRPTLRPLSRSLSLAAAPPRVRAGASRAW